MILYFHSGLYVLHGEKEILIYETCKQPSKIAGKRF